MSVLIECLTLVIPLKELDIRYPGGRDAFLHAALALEEPPRFICSADPYLANLSFYSREHIQPCVDLLVENGFTAVEANRFVDFAYVDQYHGPAMPCEWLEWRRHPDGFTLAWWAGTEPGDMAVDEDWTPERSRAQQRFDVRDEPGRMLKLAEEDGVETWLDFKTGTQIVGLPVPSTSSTSAESTSVARHSGDLFREDSPEESEPEKEHEAELTDEELAAILGELDEELAADEPLFSIVRAALTERELRFHVERKHSRATLSFQGEAAVYQVWIQVNEQTEIIAYYLQLPAIVPEPMRAAMYEAIARANYGLLIGNFEIDARDGELRFKASIDVEGGTFGTTMVHSLIGASIYAADRYYPAFMRVLYGGATPEAAIAEVES